MIIAIYHPPLICVYNSTTTDWDTTRITLPNELCTNSYSVVVAVAVSVVALWVAVKILWPPNLFALGPHWLTAHGTFIIIIILIGYVRQMIISWPGWTDDCLDTSRIYLLFAHHDDTHHDVHCELKGHPLQLLLLVLVVQWPECSIIVSLIAQSRTHTQRDRGTLSQLLLSLGEEFFFLFSLSLHQFRPNKSQSSSSVCPSI